MEDRFIEEDVKVRLILSGMSELEEHGLADFSLRRAAQRAQVSCAAPYRHFKSKEDYILEIVNYVNSKWELLSREIERVFEGDPARLVVELAIANLRFFAANSNFRSVISLAHGGVLGGALWTALSDYCDRYNLSPEERELKEYTARIILSGTIVLLGERDAEEVLSMARRKLVQEFSPLNK